VTEQEYRAAEGVNKSTLWEMRKSPAHYRYILEHPVEDTPALRFGRALHAAVLTPRIFKRDFAIAPAVDRRTKAGKEAIAEWRAALPAGAEEITADDAEIIAEMAKAIKQTPEAATLFKGTRKEVPIFWNDKTTGIKCKCRLDVWGKDWIVDLKTTSDILAFDRDAFKYGYHVQAAHYLRAVESKTGKIPKWYFVAVEKQPPFAVKIIEADPGFIDYGDFIRAELLEKVKSCRATGDWPCYAPGKITEPRWAEWGEESC